MKHSKGKAGKLGFFDSGLGGLSIMKAVEEVMPQYEYCYFGDTENLPYGDKTEKEVYELTKNGVERLFNEGAILVVLACNTASAETLRKLQDTFLIDKYPEKKILGVIIPTVEEIIAHTLRKPLLIATRRTVESRKYDLELEKLIIKHIHLQSHATPELVPLIEDGKVKDAFACVRPVLENHIESGGDGVILGCTHYTILKDLIRDAYGDSLMVISQDEIIPKKLKLYLEKHTEITTKLTVHKDNNDKEIHEHVLHS